MVFSAMLEKESAKIPKKFSNLKMSFVESLKKESTPSFVIFPKSTTFLGKEIDENVILIIRSHWFVYLPYIAAALLTLFLPFLLLAFIPKSILSASFGISIFVISFLLILSIVIYAFVRWYYNVNIITDKRVIDLDFTSIISHSLVEASLENIQDLTVKQIGVLSSTIDIGTVYIQTAGTKAELEFDNIPRPRDAQDILRDLLESKKEGKI